MVVNGITEEQRKEKTLNVAPVLKMKAKKIIKDCQHGGKSTCKPNAGGPFIKWLCNTRLTPSPCAIIAAALPLHTPQSFPLKSLNCFSDLYVERPNHMATVSWNECPYLHCSPVMGAWFLAWLERTGFPFKGREDKRRFLTHLCSWISWFFNNCAIT